MIRLAKKSEIDKIITVTKACAAFMIKNGIYQWNEHYPSKQAFLHDIAQEELFVLEVDKKIIGTIVLSTHMDDEYIPIKWLTSNEANLYIHRLSVNPDYQGQGYAQKLMNFAESYAKSNGFLSVRLDTFSINKRNVNFYLTRGYKKLGDIFFPKQSEHPFHCFELVL
ncbi:GNAT family N-acetyltransferase [Cellulophaga omnivescoria]|uniref:GNAT family N-acetyltransferase n=1 Tax=Cellulophaga omnivescoria TaxID=1888890 RepID=UPI0009843C2A|nr:GNAT family N-acetyltransferase [Cellulophaga omnivescoria]